jgi:transmembrane sensor
MSQLEELGRRIAREQDVLRSRSSARAEARERIAALETTVPRRATRRVPVLLAAAALLAVVAGAALWPRERALPPLVARIGASQRAVAAGAWVEAPASGERLSLRFSDGTHIDLAPRTRLRVIELDGHGAHLLLESGFAHVAVTPRPGASWRLSVGPFAVRVIGTRFDVGWDPEGDAFQLALSHGRVALSGCVFGGEYAMRAGQAVDASCKLGRFNVRELSDPQPIAAPEVRAEPEPIAPVAPAAIEPPAKPRAPLRARAAERDWRPLVQKGSYDEAFELARRIDLEAAPAADLALLAETARHVGAETKEEEALLLIRRRFEGTARAALAAFALGRLEFDRRHAHEKAAQWFGIYLKEQPRGPLEREARGRLIETSLAAGDRERAARLAADYLERYPSGPHAALARGLVAERAR